MRAIIVLLLTLIGICGCLADQLDMFLQPSENIKRWTDGAQTRPTTYMFSGGISPMIVGHEKDPRTEAYLLGILQTQARFLDVKFSTEGPKNIVVFVTKDILPKIVERGPSFFTDLGIPQHLAADLMKRFLDLPDCGIIPIPNTEGRVQAVIGVDYLPYSPEFRQCAELIMLGSLGAYIAPDRLRGRTFDIGLAYKFLLKIYGTADRTKPFETISEH